MKFIGRLDVRIRNDVERKLCITIGSPCYGSDRCGISIHGADFGDSVHRQDQLHHLISGGIGIFFLIVIGQCHADGYLVALHIIQKHQSGVKCTEDTNGKQCDRKRKRYDLHFQTPAQYLSVNILYFFEDRMFFLFYFLQHDRAEGRHNGQRHDQ